TVARSAMGLPLLGAAPTHSGRLGRPGARRQGNRWHERPDQLPRPPEPRIPAFPPGREPVAVKPGADPPGRGAGERIAPQEPGHARVAREETLHETRKPPFGVARRERREPHEPVEPEVVRRD